MANSYSAPNFNIDTSTNVAGLTTLKGSAPAAGDKIYIYNGATVTVDEDIALLQIILGQTSAGAAGAGNRYGLVVGTGVTITFDGNATLTNSGILSNPTSADASSKGCVASFTGCTFTNSDGALNINKKYCFNVVYGQMYCLSCTFSFFYQHITNAICCDSSRTNNPPVVRGCTFNTTGTSSAIFIISTGSCNVYCDFRYNTHYGANSLTSYYIYCGATGAFATGAIIDYAGYKFINVILSTSMFIYSPTSWTYHIANDRITYADTRQTQIVPADLAFTDTTKGGQVSFTISNAASYAATDMVVIFNNTTEVDRIGIARYNALGYGVVCGLTDGTEYTTLNAKASSDGFNFSDASANASAVTPTHTGYDFPAVANVLTIDTVDGATGTATVPAAGNVLKDSGTYGAGGTAVTPTFDEAARNTADSTKYQNGEHFLLLNVDTVGTYAGSGGVSTDPGVANVLKDVAYTISDVAKVGTFDEAARNTDPGVANVLLDTAYKIQNVAKTGTYDETLRFSDPGVSNVRALVSYKYQGSSKVGTLIPTIGLGGSNRIVSDGKNLQLI